MANKIIGSQQFIGFTEEELELIESFGISEQITDTYLDQAMAFTYELMEENGLKSIIVPFMNSQQVWHMSIQKI